MNRLLIASAALALIGAGAAYAQDANKTSTGIGTPASTAGGPNAPLSPAASFNQDNKPTPDQAGTSGSMGASTSPDTTGVASGSAMSAGGVVGDESATNPAPASGQYPICKTRHQDRCRIAAQMHRRG